MTDSPQDPRVELFDKVHIDSFPKFFPEKEHKRLFDAIKNQELIIFYGAGVSMLAGCASWYQLAINVIGAFGNSVFSDLDRTVLREMASLDPRKAISICSGYAKGNPELEAIYYGAIERSVTPSDAAAFSNIHEELFRLNPAAFITTNIDRGMERIGPELLASKKIINLPLGEIDPVNELRNGNIFYLHGAIDAIDKTILTTDQYIEYYYNSPKTYLKNFLQEVFVGRYTVLFLGYSLSEYEILQSIYLAANAGRANGNETRHFLLTPIYSRDITKFNIEKRYFGIFSVQAIPYFIDHEGFARLNYVLRELRRNMQANSPATLDLMDEIDAA